MAGQKIRIYDLAKELKLDNKRVLDDARREGVEVSVPSNTVPFEVAERIRSKYFPKKVAPAAGPRLIKQAHKPQLDTEDQQAEETPQEQQESPVELIAPEAEETDTEPSKREVSLPKIRVLKKETQPVVEPAAPVTETPDEASEVEQEVEAIEVVQPVVETAPEPVAPVTAQPPHKEVIQPPVAPVPPPARPTRTSSTPQVRQLRRLPGAPIAPPAPPASVSAGPIGSPAQARKVAVETAVGDATPKPKTSTSYVPQDTGRPRKHRRGRKRGPGEAGTEEGKRIEMFRPTRGGTIQPKPKPQFTELRPIKLIEGTTVKDFSEKLELKPKDVVQELLRRGVMATINQTLDQDTAINIGKEYGFDISFAPFEEMIVDQEDTKIIESGEEEIAERAPVVTVMGHVDHGKTSLLDAIRETRVAEGEAGGITQHIGAYSVNVPDPDRHEKLRRIVFLDTPGHEAFTMMRARGARVTDVVVLVVAADDGVMPQTIEAIDHAKAAGVPIIVAINKVDKPDAQPDRVKQELADQGLLWDGWGGDTVMVNVSAKRRENLDSLLEMIILQSDLLELKAATNRLGSGVVLEAKLDKGRGPVATVLIQQGTIKVGDPFIAGQIFGRVRAMFDDRGRNIDRVGPSTPVEVLGLQGVPQAGDPLQVVADPTQAQHIAHQRQMQARQAAIHRTSARRLEDLISDKSQVKELLVILKGDVQGSVEAVRDALNKLSTERVKIRIIRSGVGAITESDVMLASASSRDMNRAAVIIGFNVRPQTRAREIAEAESVDIRLHTIIYKIEEEIRGAMLGLLDATKREVITGHAEIRQVFRVPRIGQVAGCYVTDGTMRRTTARVLRDNIVVYEGRIDSIRRVNDDVSEVKQGFECGIVLERFQDIKAGDVIEAYITEEVAPTKL